MATTTPNFGWDIPQSTDLVKDGATAIAALGTDIDTALVDLKGGTTGQVLSKASNTDLDFTWSSVDPLTILDAKGDLISATAADTPARLASSGVNGDVLTVDTTASTGLKWATPAAASGPSFGARRITSNQSFSGSTFTKVQFNEEVWDTDNAYDPTTNYRFTPLKAGYYQVNYSVKYSVSPTVVGLRLDIYKNGSSYHQTYQNLNETAFPNVRTGSSIVYLNGSTDYIEFYIWSDAGTTRNVNNDTTVITSAVWIRS